MKNYNDGSIRGGINQYILLENKKKKRPILRKLNYNSIDIDPINYLIVKDYFMNNDFNVNDINYSAPSSVNKNNIFSILHKIEEDTTKKNIYNILLANEENTIKKYAFLFLRKIIDTSRKRRMIDILKGDMDTEKAKKYISSTNSLDEEFKDKLLLLSSIDDIKQNILSYLIKNEKK